MRAIIHSIHSQVPETVSLLGLRPETVVSLDSHLDVSLGGDDSVYPKELRIFAARTGAHTALRRIAGDDSRFVIVVPEAMLARHAIDVESQLPKTLRVHDHEKSMASAVGFMAEEMGIELYPSPPLPLMGLARWVNGKGPWLLDIDVDYMQEMQKECYTRIINPDLGVLQSMSRVVEFVRRAKPETITISEVKVSAIRDPRSAFSAFVGKLKSAGYRIEERGVFSTDAEVVRGISVCREFYRKVSRRLVLENMEAMMRGDTGRFKKAEVAAAGEFFRRKGYA